MKELDQITTLDEYLEEFGGALSDKAQELFRPLHIPGKDPELVRSEAFQRAPYPGQTSLATAAVKLLCRDRAVILDAEQGSGKSLMAVALIHEHAQLRPANNSRSRGETRRRLRSDRRPARYRALVMTPDHLLDKWVREIKSTLPGSPEVTILEDWRQVLGLVHRPPAEGSRGRRWPPPAGAEWFVIGRDRAKLGAGWIPTSTREIEDAAGQPLRPMNLKRHRYKDKEGVRHESQAARCPDCGGLCLSKEDIPLSLEKLARAKHHCKAQRTFLSGQGVDPPDWHDRPCGARLWQSVRQPNRWAPAEIIARKMKGFFGYYVADELHQCFVGSTLVSTPSGPRPIKDLRPGDRVYSRDDNWQITTRTVRRLFKRVTREGMVRIFHQQGELKCTGDHRIFSSVDNDWIPATKISNKTSLVVFDAPLDRGRTSLSMVMRTEDTFGAQKGDGVLVYDLEVEEDHCYFAGGVLVHNCKAEDTAQANALGAIASACPHFIGLTGTVMGGYAWHLFYLLMRVMPWVLRDAGFTWADADRFTKTYGKIETIVTEKFAGSGTADIDTKGKSNKQSKGTASVTRREVARPGIMPGIVPDIMLPSCLTITLEELADNLPPLTEEPIPVEMDPEHAAAYQEVHEALVEELARMLAMGNKRLLGAFNATLLGYPDVCHKDWGPVGYTDEDGYHLICIPPKLPAIQRNKERALVEAVRKSHQAGAQVWVYVEQTDRRDVIPRLQEILSAEGFRVEALRSSVDRRKREAWIRKLGQGPDVVISHPQLVETGLDLFEWNAESYNHNYSHLIFYQMRYQPLVTAQAAHRHERIGQRRPCTTSWMYYVGTAQETCMALMGQKFAAMEALKGNLDMAGLALLAGGEDPNLLMAKALVNKVRFDARAWKKVGRGGLALETDLLPRGHHRPPAEGGGVILPFPALAPSKAAAHADSMRQVSNFLARLRRSYP